MDANKPLSPRDLQTGPTNASVQNLSITASSKAQQSTSPRVHASGDAPPRFMTTAAPAAHDGPSASSPRWGGNAASAVSAQEEGATASSSSSSSNRASAAVALTSQDSQARRSSFEQRHKDKSKETYSLTDEAVMGYEELAASMKAGDRSGVIRGFTALDSRKTLTRLLNYTNCYVMADAARTGDTHLLEFLFNETKDANYQDSHYDRMMNGYGDAGGEYLLDIAASRMDLKIGLMVVEKGAKPGPNCSQQFLDKLLEQAIASRSEIGMRNLLGYGADWNLFYYSSERQGFDFICSKAFLKPACHFHSAAGNKQAVMDIFCLWAGSDSGSDERFDEEIGRCASDENHYRVKTLLQMRGHVVEADPSSPTAAMKRAIQVAACFGRAATLELLLDQQMAGCEAGNKASRDLMARATMVGKITSPSHVLDMKNQKGQTLLHLAARSGNAETVALLSSRGANLRELDGEKKWALPIAIEGQHVAAAVVLLRAALAVTDTWPGKKAMIRAAVSHAEPVMKAALMNVYAEIQPGPPAKVASPPPYGPHEEL